jgi:hypothetical protein
MTEKEEQDKRLRYNAEVRYGDDSISIRHNPFEVDEKELYKAIRKMGFKLEKK